ncbi:MAG: hypothetical protein K0S06_1615 [Microvirga sp.]|jgi:hypothetical protein|nr:hypothetical protein [Microvirga sp.]
MVIPAGTLGLDPRGESRDPLLPPALWIPDNGFAASGMTSNLTPA